MDIKELKFLLRSDLFRRTRRVGVLAFLGEYFIDPAFTIIVWQRLTYYLRFHRLLHFLYPFAAFIFNELRIRYGVFVFSATKIGSGFLIGHIGGIVVNGGVEIGKNCTLLQGVTIGFSDGEDDGAPIIGDNVYIGAGAKVIGKIKVGNNAVIGANCVVIKDVPDSAVVVGVPGMVKSFKGSYNLIKNTDYS